MAINKWLRALTLLAAAGLTQQAWAHAHPKVEVPAEGATVSAPSEVDITFDDALEPALSSITVSDGQGHALTNARAELDAATHKTLTLKLSNVPAGVYLVKWVAVSLDGHRTSGSYKFTVK